VRKQYHFWPGEEGLDAWDVDRLIRLARGLPVREVPLDAIKDLDTDYWFAGSSEAPTVRKVVEHSGWSGRSTRPIRSSWAPMAA